MFLTIMHVLNSFMNMNISMAWHVLVWHKCLLPPCQMTRDAAMRLCNEAVAGEIVLNPQRLQLLQQY